MQCNSTERDKLNSHYIKRLTPRSLDGSVSSRSQGFATATEVSLQHHGFCSFAQTSNQIAAARSEPTHLAFSARTHSVPYHAISLEPQVV